MDPRFEPISLASFPAFWIVFAVGSIVMEIYLVIFAHKRSRGEKIYFPIETIAFGIDSLVLGKKEAKRRWRLLEKDYRRNRMVVVSARAGSIGCMIMATYCIIVALFLQ